MTTFPNLPARDDNTTGEHIGSKFQLPPCHSRHDWDRAAGQYFCSHPRVHASRDIVSHAVCASCSYWQDAKPEQPRPFPTLQGVVRNGPCVFLGPQLGLRECGSCQGNVKVKVFRCDHERHQETTFRECKRCVDYERQLKPDMVKEWAVGVTAAPRENSTIERTLSSLKQAGWRKTCVFAEPGTTVPADYDGLVVRRGTSLGPWPNWYLALVELYLRMPDADAFLVIQDDVVFCRNIRPYLEATLWPSERVGVVSLYCSSAYPFSQTGFQKAPASHGVLGALALIFPQFAVRSLLSDRGVIAHRTRPGRAGLRYIDTVIGCWSERARLPALVHNPSLAQHIGSTSTAWPGAQNRGKRRAEHFVGEEFNALSLVETGP